jgi:general secretion pathway protein G
MHRKQFGRHRKPQHGFTLIEVMVVVVILAILATVVVPRIMDRPDQARVTRAQQDIRAVEAALNLYRLDNFRYPSTDDGLEALVPKYLDSLPEDPWGNRYLYLSPGEKGEFDVYSYGADGTEGGEGVDKDIGNWNKE